MKLRIVRANDIRFTCYVHGDGPQLLLLLHGFPDDAASMLPLMERLDQARYTMAAPYMRGYGPTSRSPDRRYLLEDLGRDVLALIDALGHERAAVFGHDWGALAAYTAAQLAPSQLTHLITASVPPPRVFLHNLPRAPRQLLRSWYILLFQLPLLNRAALTRDDLELVELLWRLWSPGWRWERSRLAKVKNTLGRAGTPGAALRYYRGLLLDAILDRRRWRRSLAIAMRPISTPTLVLAGARDGCVGPELYDNISLAFAEGTPHALELLDGCGHFPQHERPDTLTAALCAFLEPRGDEEE